MSITEGTEWGLAGLHDEPWPSRGGCLHCHPGRGGGSVEGQVGSLYLPSSLSLCVLLRPQIGDHKFSAHRIVLAASIPYFHAMFTNDMMECKQDEIVMQGMDPRYCAPPPGLPAASLRSPAGAGARCPPGPAAGHGVSSTAQCMLRSVRGPPPGARDRVKVGPLLCCALLECTFNRQ